MRLWKRLRIGWAALLLLVLAAAAANATPTDDCPGSSDDPFNLGSDPIPSGDGTLEFSNFQFHSPSCSVDPSELAITILDDGVEIAGPITLNALNGGDWAKFFVSYEVTAVDLPIGGASLELASSIGGPLGGTTGYSPEIGAPGGVVFATKRVIGEHPDSPDGHPSNHHGWGHLGWGLFDLPESFPQGKTLAFLKTAEWDVGESCLCDLSLGWLCDGEFRFDAEEFAPLDSVKVIDGVWIKALGEDSSVTFFSSTNRFRVVPEPATGALLMLGLVGLAIGGRKR